MGGVPVLLMMAAIGITYGWQPDNNGGVEYVIQIPPDQLHEIERLGEISSVIDPEVQGHVSRVIIRVGNEPLRRITPPNLGRRSESLERDDAVIAASDQSPVPIPEMDDVRRAIPIPGLDAMAWNSTGTDSREMSAARERPVADPEAVMKPDTGNTGTGNTGTGNTGTGNTGNGTGFTFPSLPPSLGNAASRAAEGIRSDVDRAGRELGTRATNEFNGALGQAGNTLESAAADARSVIRIPPPPTRSNGLTQPQAPQFTGGDPRGELARPRAGGPSTEPTNTRDNSWRDLMTPPATASSGETSLSNPFANRAGTSQTNSLDPGANRQGATGLAPSDTFGKLPSGLGPPTLSDDRPSIYADRNSQTTANGYSQGGYSQAEQAQFDRQSAYAEANQAGRSQYDPPTAGQGATAGSYAQGAPATYDPRSSYGNDRQQTSPRTPMSPDSRLTAAQIAAGAWSVDAYGRPVDRDGRLLVASNPSTGPSSYDPQGSQRLGPYPDRTYGNPGQPNTNSTAEAELQARLRQSQLGYDPPPPSNTANPNSNFAREPPSNRELVLRRGEVDLRDPRLTQTPPDPPLRTDGRTLGAAESGVQSRPQVAAQPLFNGLLLISFVANVYLIFWLKNLRLQFHDLVAAKRLGNSNTPAT